MKTISVIMLMLIVSFSAGFAQENEKDADLEFLSEFLNGSYHLIGKQPDSERTYSGKVTIWFVGGQWEVTRIIEGHEIKGIGKVEIAAMGEEKVLRVRFRQKKRGYEVTYLIDSDLNNYGRLSGYLYLEEGGTKSPGLEALFIE